MRKNAENAETDKYGKRIINSVEGGVREGGEPNAALSAAAGPFSRGRETYFGQRLAAVVPILYTL